MLCLHGAYVLDYSSDRFTLTHALSENLKSSEKVLETLFSKGCRRVIWTSSVFEDAVNLNDTQSSKPGWYRYALSKYLSYAAISELCRGCGYEFSRVVVTNPFGPLEDKKLSYYLFNSFLNKEKEFYNQDSLLCSGYDSCSKLSQNLFEIIISKECIPEIRPCEYSGSMISFAKLYIEEVSKRLTVNLKINSQIGVS